MTTRLNGWTSEEDAILEKMWQRGETCAAIARHLTGKSRDAVIGRAHRLQLPKHVRWCNQKRITA